MASKIIWAPRAYISLENNFEYIAKDSLKYAKVFVREIRERIQILKNNPMAVRKLPELNLENYRELIYKSYRIIYKVEEKSVEILLVRQGAKPIDNIVKLL